MVLTWVLACLSTASIWAADIRALEDAFRSGNAPALATYMDTEVYVAFEGATSEQCAGKEATARLETFFRKNKPSAFRVIHHADKKETGFFVAKLSAGGKEYRVNLTYRAEGDKAIIQSIRIE